MLTQTFVRYASTFGCVLALLTIWCSPGAEAQTEVHNALIYRATAKTSQLTLTEKEARLLELPARIRTVDGFDPSIVKITTVDNFHQVRLLALAPGFTTVTLVDENGQGHNVDVLVNGDVKQFQALIRQAAPGSSVQAIKVKDAVLLLGWVDQAGQATKIVELAEMHFSKVLNYLQVSGVQTIMLRVRMMEAQRSKIRNLGFNFLEQAKNGFVASLPGSLVSLAAGNASGSTQSLLGQSLTTANPAAITMPFGITSSNNTFLGLIEALRTENLLTVLAEPNLVTTNGRPANFLDGGQFPVPIPQGLGTVSIQYKSFGVQLEFVPTILSSGRLRMQVSPEVSSKDFSNSVVVQGINVPSLITRRVNTEVEMNFGETLIIGGLISNQVTATSSKIPFLGELPWIGAAFRRVSHNEAETELIVLVTPELVSPVDESQLPDGPGRSTTSPTDRELYWNGYLEAPRYAPTPEPPTTHFGFPSSYTAPPPTTLVPSAGGAPKYDGNGAQPSAPGPGGDLDAPPPAPGNGNGGTKVTPPAPATGTDGEDGPSLDEASRSRVRGSLSDPATRRVSASRRPNPNTVRTLQPSRGTTRPGSVVQATGNRPQPSSAADDGSTPGLISP
jgi:pilus assembly protein CpaC